MAHPTLFHLHFNTLDVEGTTDRLARAGIPLQRRFGSVRGENVALEPGDSTPEEFRFKLQVHQRGSVNITIAPGQRPHFDHLGLTTEEFENVLDRAESQEWSVRRNERRTFVMTPWRFRIEVHPSDADVVTELGDFGEARIEDALLRLPDAGEVQTKFDTVFGDVSELRIESGEGPWLESLTLADEWETQEIDVQTLLGSQNASA